MIHKVMIGVIVAMGIGMLGLWIDNSRLESKVNELESALVVCNTNKYQLESAVKSQNDKIEQYRVDIEAKKEEYEKLLGQEPEIRYKTVYKSVPNIEVKSDECEDIKKLLDSIRDAGF